MEIAVRTYDRVQLASHEISLTLDELMELPWVKARVAKVVPSRLGVELEIGPYAGTLVLGSAMLRVQELVPGTVAACLSLSKTGRRFGRQLAQGGLSIRPDRAVALAFAEELEGWVGRGIQKAYVERQFETARPRGKLLPIATARGPWARGHSDRLVVRQRPLTENTATNRYVLAAGLRAASLLHESPSDLRSLRECLVALSGAAVERYPQEPPATEIRDVETLALVQIARSLLEGVPAIAAGASGPGASAFSGWVNVERIFEEAVLNVCRRLRPGMVTSGKSCDVTIFHHREGEPRERRKRADPDVVVRTGGRTVILDAKYRRSGERPTDDEIYQLISHAGAFGASAAALVAPALTGEPGVTWLGRLADGCAVEVIAVDPRDPDATEVLLGAWLDRWASD